MKAKNAKTNAQKEFANLITGGIAGGNLVPKTVSPPIVQRKLDPKKERELCGAPEMRIVGSENAAEPRPGLICHHDGFDEWGIILEVRNDRLFIVATTNDEGEAGWNDDQTWVPRKGSMLDKICGSAVKQPVDGGAFDFNECLRLCIELRRQVSRLEELTIVAGGDRLAVEEQDVQGIDTKMFNTLNEFESHLLHCLQLAMCGVTN